MIQVVEKRANALVDRGLAVVKSQTRLLPANDPVLLELEAISQLIHSKVDHLASSGFSDDKSRSEDMLFIDRLFCLLRDTEEQLVPYFEYRGSMLSRMGKDREALEVWERVFSVIPELAKNHAGLTALASSGHGDRVAKIRARYAFKEIGSFSNPDLRSPYAVGVSAENGFLLVSSPNLSDFYKYSFDGDFIETVEVAETQSFRMISGDSGRIWVCDFKGARLVGIGRPDQPVESLELDFITSQYPNYKPLFGDYDEGRFCLVLSEEMDRKNSIMAVFDLGSPSQTVVIHSLKDILPADACVRGDRVWLLSNSHGGMYEVDVLTGDLHRFYSDSLGQRGLCFSLVDDYFFVSATGSFSKIDLNGNTVYRRNLFTYGNKKGFLKKGMGVFKKGDSHLLFLGDNRGAVDIFEV